MPSECNTKKSTHKGIIKTKCSVSISTGLVFFSRFPVAGGICNFVNARGSGGTEMTAASLLQADNLVENLE